MLVMHMMTTFCRALVLMSVLLAACDGYFGALDADLTAADAGSDATATEDATTPTPDLSNNDSGPDPAWNSVACGDEGVACAAGDVCLDGLCGPVVDIAAGPTTFCAVQQTNSNTRVLCWGLSGFIVSIDDANISDASWGFVAGAIQPGESFHALDVGTNNACVLVQADDAVELTLRCWGNDPFSRGTTQGVIEQRTVALDPTGANDIDLHISEGLKCITGSFEFEESTDTRHAACWGSDLVDADGGALMEPVIAGRLPEDVSLASLIALGDPGLLDVASNAVCYTSADLPMDNPVRCAGSVGSEPPDVNESTGLGEITSRGELDVGAALACGVNERGVRCYGDRPPGYDDLFDSSLNRSFRNVRVGPGSQTICARASGSGEEIIDCLLNNESTVRSIDIDGDPDGDFDGRLYDVAENMICGTRTRNVTQLVCWTRSDGLWPGAQVDATPRN
jgi:hypothetical protein